MKVGILLMAAGGSRRMGDTIKQLLPWKETNLINHAIKTARGSKADFVKVVLGAYAGEIRKTIPHEVECYTCEEWELGLGTSIAYGVKRMFGSEEPDKILIMLADQPYIDPEFINLLIRKASSSESLAGDSEEKVESLSGDSEEEVNRGDFEEEIDSVAGDPEEKKADPEEEVKIGGSEEKGRPGDREKGPALIIASCYKDKAGVPAVFDRKLFEQLCRMDGDKGARDIIRRYRDKAVLIDNPEAEKDIDTMEDFRKMSRE